jgi:hypothetical protein
VKSDCSSAPFRRTAFSSKKDTPPPLEPGEVEDDGTRERWLGKLDTRVDTEDLQPPLQRPDVLPADLRGLLVLRHQLLEFLDPCPHDPHLRAEVARPRHLQQALLEQSLLLPDPRHLGFEFLHGRLAGCQ